MIAKLSPWYLPKGAENLWPHMFIAALFLIAQTWKPDVLRWVTDKSRAFRGLSPAPAPFLPLLFLCGNFEFESIQSQGSVQK